MSNVKNQLTEDMKNAMRARDMVRLNVIRFVLSELKNFEIDNGEQDDAGVRKIIAREIKKVKDALVDFERAGRQDLIDQETAKVKIMESYLPAQMSDDELLEIVKKAVSESGQKEFGPVMKAAMSAVQGQAGGDRVSAMVKKVLSA